MSGTFLNATTARHGVDVGNEWHNSQIMPYHGISDSNIIREGRLLPFTRVWTVLMIDKRFREMVWNLLPNCHLAKYQRWQINMYYWFYNVEWSSNYVYSIYILWLVQVRVVEWETTMQSDKRGGYFSNFRRRLTVEWHSQH